MGLLQIAAELAILQRNESWDRAGASEEIPLSGTSAIAGNNDVVRFSEINFVEISFEFREIIDSRRVAIKAKIVRNFRLNLKTNQFIMVLLEEINYTSQTRPQSVGGRCGLYCASLGVRILLFFSFLDK